MAPTLVNVAVGVLLGVALLGVAFDRRSIATVGLAAALPDLDVAVSLLVPEATNAAFHSVFLAAVVGGVLYWDTERRETSWLRDRYGFYGVRVAWVALASFVVAGIALDLGTSVGVALLYPLVDRYYVVSGRLVLSNQEGVVQTYFDLGEGWLALETTGRPSTHHVETWVNPTPDGANPADSERRLRLVESGWQLVTVVTAIAAVPAKYTLEGDR
ncbi:metal-dependent hydrolase [Natrialbaceae archaeon AArc-T1-2]|uniref:metal-dependent hydrolase n=1 Tax=Natrialbaceae archaeon AArc-T1-2 TaxID=3053904 RepID=UPI00255AAC8A|nr:metal-dependent hydrolase [Natrialbaceae archaeon AArc-T1-2]WIV66581.1 metal-dependent hydrolase [Natrialbaceae archaeon AArc-T1-2]